jgi:alkanesulfonate monooxygenase SsuD/methylene tetrahydromethanopterin reductase-like flavin-dependent oxidoreductase (luciferase family)
MLRSPLMKVFGVLMPESRARFEEAFEIIRGAWTEEVFNFEGTFWKFKDVALWPRPVQLRASPTRQTMSAPRRCWSA